MPHFPIPADHYSSISAIRLSTQSTLTLSIPPANVPEPPRPQYDTMKAYQRLEKAGTIASLESLQQNIRPLFAYPVKDFQTPRRKRHSRSRKVIEEEEDLQPLLSSSLQDTSELLDSIFTSSSPTRDRRFESSPRTSVDFSSSLPYPSERKQREVWPSSPPVRHGASSTPALRNLPSNPPDRNRSDPVLPSSARTQRVRSSHAAEDSSHRSRTPQRVVPPAAVRSTHFLEDISEDEASPHGVYGPLNSDVHAMPRRSRLSLRVERAVGWVLRR